MSKEKHMHKKILIHILSLLLTLSLPMSGMISVRAEEPEDEEAPSEVVELTEEEEPEETAPEIEGEIPEEQNEQIDLYQPETEETITEETPEITPEEETEEEVLLEEPEETEELPEEEPEPAEEAEEEAETLADNDPYFYVGGIAIPAEGTGIFNVETEYLTSGTITFDYETRTLTLDNAQVTALEVTTPANMAFISYNMYDNEELTLKLAGSSSIVFSAVDDWAWNAYGILVGAPLYITSDDGTGSLNIKVSAFTTSGSEMNRVTAIYATTLRIANCKITAESGQYALQGYKGIEFEAGSDVEARITAVNTYTAPLHTDIRYKIIHNPIDTDMTGYENVDDETGTALNKSEYLYEDYDYEEMNKYRKVTVKPRINTGSIILEGNCGAEGDNITFTLTDEGVLTLTGTGAMQDYEESYYYSSDTAAPWYNSDVTYVSSVIVGEGITHIGNYAFYNCTLLAEVSLPSTLETIGNYAFSRDLSLEEIALPDSVRVIGEQAFESCTNLRSVTLPSSLEHIGDAAFFNCKSLQGIEIPETVTYIGRSAFEECRALAGSVTIPDGITKLENDTFQGCVNLEHINLPESLKTIGDYALYACTKLTEITIPSTVSQIGEDAFYNTGLISIVIPEGVSEIKYATFSHCYDLVSITLPSTLKRIANYAFWNCTSLNEITFPDGLEYIGQQAFESCTALEEIIIPDSVTDMGGEPFRYCTSATKVVIGNGIRILPYEAFSGCTSLTDLTIGTGVDYLGRYPFKSCTSLETVVIPDNVIGSYSSEYEFSDCVNLKNVTLSQNMFGISTGMFMHCFALEEIELPESLTSIGSYAFTQCESLKSIRIPANVTSIGESAFNYCINLETVDMPADLNMDVISSKAFTQCTSLKEITIPDKVRGIGTEAFENCTALETVNYNGVLENSIYYESYAVGYEAFRNCSSLTHLELTFKGKDAVIQSDAFRDLAADVVHVYGIPGGALENNASSLNYTFHPVGFTVQYFANGAEGEMEDQIIDYTDFTDESEPYYFTPNVFTNGDLTFIGWNTKADGSGTNYEDGQEVPIDIPSSGIMTLYAQWAEGYDLWIMGKLIHSKNKDDIYLALNGYSNPSYPVTYDPDTNTLTLNPGFNVTNYNSIKEGAGPEYYSGLYYGGDGELTIVVKRTASFNGSSGQGVPDICNLYSAGSLRIVFNKDENYYSTPKLDVGSNSRYYDGNTDMTGMYVGGNLTISGSGNFYVRSDYAGEGHSYALRMAGGILRLQDQTSVDLMPGYGEAGAHGLYLDGNTTLRALNWESQMRINGNNSPAIAGASGVTLSQRNSELDLLGYSTASFSGDRTPLTESSYPISSLAQYPGIRANHVNHVMTVSLAYPDRNYVYTGSAIKPEIIVSCAGNTLYEGKDYTVKYKNNTKAFVLPEGIEKDQEGFMELTAKKRKTAPQITVTGKGNFKGSTTLYFEIGQKSIAPGDTADGTVPVKAADLTIVSGTKASPILYYGTNKLTTKDFTTSPAASVKYKESTVMTITGKGNYTGTVEIPVTVVPTKADLKNIAVDFGPKSIVYDGTDRKEEILAGITVYDAMDKVEKTDIGQEHYSLTMSGNTKDAGTVKVTVTGINGYSGTKTASIKIVPNTNIEIKVYNDYEEGTTYNGYAKTGFLNVYADVDGEGEGDDKYETRLVEGKDFKVTYKNNTNVTTAKKKASYTISFIGSYKGKKAISGKFDIFPKKIQNAYIEMIPDKVYTKPGAYASKPFVSYNGFTLKAGKDYTLSYYRKVTEHYDHEAGRYVYDLIGPITSKKGQMITDEDFVDANGNVQNQIYVYVVMRGKGNFASSDSNDINWRSYMIRKQQPSETVKYLDMSKATVTITKKNAKGKVVKVTSFPYTGNTITFDTNGSGSPNYAADIKITYKYDKKTTLTLVSGTDFYINYYNNVNKGTATVVIRGRNNPRTFYDQNGQPVKDLKGNELGYIGFTGAKSTNYKIISEKIANLLKKIFGN